MLLLYSVTWIAEMLDSLIILFLFFFFASNFKKRQSNHYGHANKSIYIWIIVKKQICNISIMKKKKKKKVSYHASHAMNEQVQVKTFTIFFCVLSVYTTEFSNQM